MRYLNGPGANKYDAKSVPEGISVVLGDVHDCRDDSGRRDSEYAFG